MKVQDMTQRYRKFQRACLRAEDINWDTRTICFTRKKLKSRGKSIKPTLFRFSADIEAVLKRRPAVRAAFSVSLHGEGRGSGDGVQAAL